MKNSLLKQYIDNVVSKEAKVKFDKSVNQWIGILHHLTGSIYSQRKTKAAVEKELAEILEEFIALYFEDIRKDKRKEKILERIYEITTPKIQRAYR